MSTQLDNFLEHINSEVAKLSTSNLEKLTEVLDAAEVELTHALATWKALGKGDAVFTPQLYRNALVQIRGTLEHIRGPLAEGIASQLRHGGALAAHLATKHLIQEVHTFSSMFEGSIRPVAIEAAGLLASGDKMLFRQFSTSAKRYAGQVGEDIRRQLAIGVVRGETVDQLTNRLGKLGGPSGLVYLRGAPGEPNAKAEYIAEGLFKRYRHYAERLVVTEVVNTYNALALVGMDDLEANDPGYFKRWDAAIDGRTCPNCGEYSDTVVGLNEKFRGGIDHPPLHPRCRCAVVIWRKEWAEHKGHLAKTLEHNEDKKGLASIPKQSAKKKELPVTKEPGGFSHTAKSDGNTLFDKKPTIRQGIPTYKEAKKNKYRENAYVTTMGDLAQKNLYGIDTGGHDINDERTQGMIEAWKKGKELPAIEIDVNKKGQYFIADGNHRAWAALHADNRDVLVRFRPSDQTFTSMDHLSDSMKKFLNPVK